MNSTYRNLIVFAAMLFLALFPNHALAQEEPRLRGDAEVCGAWGINHDAGQSWIELHKTADAGQWTTTTKLPSVEEARALTPEHRLDSLITANDGRQAFTGDGVDPNGAIKVIRRDENGNLIVVYFGHSDEGAFEDLRNAARDGNLTGNNGSAVTDKGITTFEVTQNTVLTGGDGGPIYVEDIIYNAQAGTHFVTCESYGANNVVDGQTVTTSAWRYLELKPTPTPPQQAQVQPQPRLSRGWIAQQARKASTIREIRAQARIEKQGISTSTVIYQTA